MSDDEPTTPPTDPFPFRFSAAIFLLYVSAFLFHFSPAVWSHSRILAFCIPPRIRLPLPCAKPFRFSLAHSCALSFPFYSSHPLRAHTSTTATIDAFGRFLPTFPSPPSLALTQLTTTTVTATGRSVWFRIIWCVRASSHRHCHRPHTPKTGFPDNLPPSSPQRSPTGPIGFRFRFVLAFLPFPPTRVSDSFGRSLLVLLLH